MQIANHPVAIAPIQTIARWLGQRIAWNYPMLYFKLVTHRKLSRFRYYQLVRNCRSGTSALKVVGRQNVRHLGPAKKRNILYVIHWFDLGGAESYALYTIKIARQLGHSCFCIATVPGTNSEKGLFEQLCNETIDHNGIGDSERFTEFIANYIIHRHIDIVHIHHSALMYEALPYIRERFPELLIVDSTHIVEYEDGGFPRFSAQYSPYIDKHNVISKNLIVVQRTLYHCLHGAELGLDKFYLTYLCGIFQYRDNPVRDANRARIVVTFYGRLVRQKQLHIFVATMERLFSKYPKDDVVAHIYGAGEMQSALIAKIEKSRFRNRIKFFGRCDDKEEVFKESDILLITSLNEGISLTTYEALSSGCLVLSTDVGAQAEILCDECLIPMNARLIEESARRIHRLVVDREQIRLLLAQNRKSIRGLKRHQVNASAIEALYGYDRCSNCKPAS